MNGTHNTPTAQRIHLRLMETLQPGVLEVLDETAQHAGHAGTDGRLEGTHMRVRIDSPLFAGKVRLAKHRLVYDALQDFMDAGLHALAIEIVDSSSHASPKVQQ
jgi:BolA protein